jgi:hypothetical protein
MTRLRLLVCATILIWPTRLGVVSVPITRLTVVDTLNLNVDQRDVAKRIEKRLRDHRLSDGIIIGAIVNAYAESRLNPLAVGDGQTRGVFQLLPSGLGHGMSPQEMHSVEIASDRIAAAVKKSKKLMAADRAGSDTETITMLFCTEIERPANKEERAVDRVALLRRLRSKKSKSLQKSRP